MLQRPSSLSIFNKFYPSWKIENLLLTCINFYSAHRSWKIGLKQIAHPLKNPSKKGENKSRKTDDYKKTIYSNGKQAFVFNCEFMHENEKKIQFLNECQNKTCHYSTISRRDAFHIFCWRCVHTEDMLIYRIC